MDYEEFISFRSRFYFLCGREFFLKELGIKSDKERPIPQNHVVLCNMFKKRGAKVPDFYGYYNLWRSCNKNVFVEYDHHEKKFLFLKKFRDDIKNEELYDFVNYKISSSDGASQRFGKSVKFFKYLCALTFAKKSKKSLEIDEILEQIENEKLKIPSFDIWNRNICKVVWNEDFNSFKLEKCDYSSGFCKKRSRKNSSERKKSPRASIRRNICKKIRSTSTRELNSSPNSSFNELKNDNSNSDSDFDNYVHPEDILWDYEAILNERNKDGKIQFLVKWKDFGPYKFEPSWENESMVNCVFSRKRREPVKKFHHIDEIDKPEDVIDYFNKMKY